MSNDSGDKPACDRAVYQAASLAEILTKYNAELLTTTGIIKLEQDFNLQEKGEATEKPPQSFNVFRRIASFFTGKDKAHRQQPIATYEPSDEPIKKQAITLLKNLRLEAKAAKPLKQKGCNIYRLCFGHRRHTPDANRHSNAPVDLLKPNNAPVAAEPSAIVTPGFRVC